MARIATTIEQGKKLEELGISTNTSDMSIWRQTKDWKGRPIERKMRIDATPFNQLSHIVMGVESFEEYPAWSLGALIKLLPNEIKNKRFNIVYYLTINKDSITYSNRMEDEECEYECYGDLFDCCVEMIEALKSSEYGL